MYTQNLSSGIFDPNSEHNPVFKLFHNSGSFLFVYGWSLLCDLQIDTVFSNCWRVQAFSKCNITKDAVYCVYSCHGDAKYEFWPFKCL